LQLYAEKDRNGVPVIKKEQERARSGAFRLETNPAMLLLRLSYQWRIQEEMVGGFFPFAALPSLPQNGPLKRCKLPVRVRAEPVRQMLLSILVQKSLLGVTVSSKQIK